MQRTKIEPVKRRDAANPVQPAATERPASAAARDYEKPKIVRVRRVLAAGGHSV